MLEMQTAHKVCHVRGPTAKNNHLAMSEVNSWLHEFALLEAVTLLYIGSRVSAGAEKLLHYNSISSITLNLTLLYLTTF